MKSSPARRPSAPASAPAIVVVSAGSPAGQLQERLGGRPGQRRVRPHRVTRGRARRCDLWRAEWVVTPAGPWDYWLRREGIDLLASRLVQFITLVLGLVVVFRKPIRRRARGSAAGCSRRSASSASRFRTGSSTCGGAAAAGRCRALWVPFACTLRAARAAAVVLPELPAARPALAGGLAGHLGAGRGRGRRRTSVLLAAPSTGPTAAPARSMVRVAVGWVDWLPRRRRRRRVRPSYRRADPIERRRLGVLLLGGGIGAVAGGPIALAYLARVRNDALRLAGRRRSRRSCCSSSRCRSPTRSSATGSSTSASSSGRVSATRSRAACCFPSCPSSSLVMVVDVYWNRDRSIAEQIGVRAPLYAGSSPLALVAQWQRQTLARRARPAVLPRALRRAALLHSVVEERAPVGQPRAGGVAGRGADRGGAASDVRDALLARGADGDVYRAWRRRRRRPGPPSFPADAKLFALARRPRASRSTCRPPGPLGSPSSCRRTRRRWSTRSASSCVVPIDAGPGRPDAVLVLGRTAVRGAVRDRGPATAVDDRREPGRARPAATGTASPDDSAFQECPRCGTCYDSGTSTCAGEPTPLSPCERCLASSRGGIAWSSVSAAAGMGVVYGASDLSLDRSVAVKVLREELVGDRESAERFEREAQDLGQLHPSERRHDLRLRRDRAGRGRSW